MQRLKIDQDIRPLSEFRTGVTSFIKQIHKIAVSVMQQSTLFRVKILSHTLYVKPKIDAIYSVSGSKGELAQDDTVFIIIPGFCKGGREGLLHPSPLPGWIWDLSNLSFP